MKPFSSNFDYLDAAHAYLAARSRRLGMDRSRRVAALDALDDEPCFSTIERYNAITEREQTTKTELVARLAAHRADKTAIPLAIDRLAHTLDLSEDERLVLSAATWFAVSEDGANVAFADLGTGYGGDGSVEFYLRLLACNDAESRVRARRVFAPEGALVRAGLLHIDFMRNDEPQPADLLWSRVVLTHKGFEAMTGADQPEPTP